jgi:hypothetical protein
MDIPARCHRCARAFEIVAYEDEVDESVYTVPEGQRASCPWCGLYHQAGVEMTLEAAA